MRVHCVLRVYLPLLQVTLEEFLEWRIHLVGSDGILVILSLDVSFNIPLFIILNSVFGIVIMYFSETLMYEMDLCCNTFSLLDP